MDTIMPNQNKVLLRWQILLIFPFLISFWRVWESNNLPIIPEDPTQPIPFQKAQQSQQQLQPKDKNVLNASKTVTLRNSQQQQQQQDRKSAISKTNNNEIEYFEGSFQYLNDTVRYRYSPRMLKRVQAISTLHANQKLPTLLFGITSNPQKSFPRQAIRKSWALDAPAFVFTIAGEWTDALAEEFQLGDLLWIDMNEDYKMGLTRKTLTLFHLAATTSITQHVDYVFKTDEDVYVNVTHMGVELTENGYPEYYGLSNPRDVVRPETLEQFTPSERADYQKFVVTWEEYPEELYPPYAAGVGYALSKRLAKCAGNAISSVFSPSRHHMPWEDVSVGMLVAHCNGTLVPANWDHFIDHQELIAFPYERYKDGTELVKILHKVKPMYFEPLYKHEPLGTRKKKSLSTPEGRTKATSESKIEIQGLYYFNSLANPKRRAFMEDWLSKQHKRNPKNPNQPFIKYKRIESICDSKMQTIKYKGLAGNANTRSYRHLFFSQIDFYKGQTLIFQDDTIQIQIPPSAVGTALGKNSNSDQHRFAIPLLEEMIQEQNIPNNWEVIRLDCYVDGDGGYGQNKWEGTTTDPNKHQKKWWKQSKKKALPLYSNDTTTQKCVKSNAMIYQTGVLGQLSSYVSEDISMDLDCTVPQLFRTYCVNLDATTRNLTLQAEEPEQRVVEEDWFLQDTGQIHASTKEIQAFVRNQKGIMRRDCNSHLQKKARQEAPEKKSSLPPPPPTCYPPNRHHTRIDQIIYHSLEKNKLRQTLMETWLPLQRIPYKRVKALKGVKTGCHPNIKTPERCQGVSGLLFTLLHILDHHIDVNSRNTTTMILEDDIAIVDKTMHRLKLALELVPGDWDIVRFDTWGMYDFQFQWANPLVANTSMGTITQAPTCQDRLLEESNEKPCAEKLFGGTYAMLLKDSSRDKLRTIWNSTKYYADADMLIAQTPGIVSYSLNLGMFEHFVIRSELSDISLFEQG